MSKKLTAVLILSVFNIRSTKAFTSASLNLSPANIRNSEYNLKSLLSRFNSDVDL